MPPVYSKISENDKQRLFEAYQQGEDYIQLAKLLNIKRTTAYHIIKRAETNGGAVAKPRGGVRHSKMTREMKNTIRDIVERHPDFTIRMINEELRRQLPQAPQVGRSTISSTLEGLMITLKKLEDVPAKRNAANTKNLRLAQATWLMQNIQNADFIYIDEAGINLWTRRTRGRAPRRQRAVRVVQGRRRHNLTMTFAVNTTTGLAHHELSEGGMTALRFNEFLQTVCQQYNGDGQCFLIIDNAPAHRQAQNLQMPPNFFVRYLPPYSPFLNICENAFSLWKGAIKDQLAEVRPQLLVQPYQERMATLGQIAEQNTAVVTPEKIQAAFRGLQAYLPACFNMDDIYM